MQLARFRVRMFRSIIDSGDVPVFPLTALVGRRRSGKSTLLRVLSAMHPDGAEGFSLEHDWPRDRRQHRSPEQVACETEYALDEQEAKELAQEWGVHEAPAGMVIERDYRDRFHASLVDADGVRSRPREAEPTTLRRWLPRVLHLDQQAFLARDTLARANLGELRWKSGRRGDPTMLSLLDLAGLEPGELVTGLTPNRVSEANARLAPILDDVDPARRLRVVCEQGRFDLVMRSPHRLDLPIDEAPDELVWRWTLALLLAAVREAPGRGILLLLDGPGRWIRADDRRALRRTLAEICQECGPVIYTSRMPFEMDLQHPEQVLVLATTEEGPVVARDFAAHGRATAPLRAALGMTGRSSFQVAELNLVVEGQIDAELLLAWSALLERSGEPGLPDGINVIRAGGSYEVTSASVFLARQGLGVIALFDSDHAGREACANLRDEAARDSRVRRVIPLLLGEAGGLERDEAAIEDLYPRESYLEAIRAQASGRAADRALARLARSGDGKIARQAQRAFEVAGGSLSKSDVAKRLRDDLDRARSLDDLPPELLVRIRALMRAIQAAAATLGSS